MFIPKIHWLHNQSNVGNQNDTNSSLTNSIDEDNGQSSFDSLNQYGSQSDTMGPWFFRTDASSSTQPLFGWGAGFGPSPVGSLGDSSPSHSSVSAASGSSPGGSVPSASAASGPSLGGSSQTVSMAGSGLVFNNTYDASCSAQFIACIVSAEDELESLFTNSITINESFCEANQGNTGGALGNSLAIGMSLTRL
jgi:hypothetical protein